MRWKARREKFRAILSGETCVNPASVYDPISARIAEDLGFECGMFAGSVAALTILGAPDHIVITLTEFAEQCHRIARAGALPLMVDADHGYGNALNVMRTVEELEAAGVAGLSIEDTTLPMTHGSPRKPQLISIAEAVGKMKAAVAARRDPSLVIAGRTLLPATTLEDAIARVTAFEKTGVDMIFAVGVKTREELEALSAAVSLPIMLGGGGDIGDTTYLASEGVRVALVGHQPIAAATQAVHDTLKAIREGKRGKELKGVAAPALMQSVTRNADYDHWIDDFLGGQ